LIHKWNFFSTWPSCFSASWFSDHSHDQLCIKKKSFQWSLVRQWKVFSDWTVLSANLAWFANHTHDQLCFKKQSVQWILIRKWNVFSAWPSHFSGSWFANHSHDQLCIKARQHTKSLILLWWASQGVSLCVGVLWYRIDRGKPLTHKEFDFAMMSESSRLFVCWRSLIQNWSWETPHPQRVWFCYDERIKSSLCVLAFFDTELIVGNPSPTKSLILLWWANQVVSLCVGVLW